MHKNKTRILTHDPAAHMAMILFAGRAGDHASEGYLILIDQHFQTEYQNCDYRINHFFSGSIRELRFYETCY